MPLVYRRQICNYWVIHTVKLELASLFNKSLQTANNTMFFIGNVEPDFFFNYFCHLLSNNPQSGDLANSFRLISVVSHIGSSSSSGKHVLVFFPFHKCCVTTFIRSCLTTTNLHLLFLRLTMHFYFFFFLSRSLHQRCVWHEEAVMADL